MPLAPLTTRSGKGSALTHPEVDANWNTLEDFANALEDRIDVSLNSDGSIKTEKVPYATTVIGSDAYAVTIAGTIAAVTDLAGRVILVRIDVSNTGPASLNVNGLGATSIKKNGATDLASGDLKPGIAALTYDATNSVFNLLNPGTNSKDNYSATTNVGNDYTITVSSLSSSTFEIPVALYGGYRVTAKINAANTSAATLAIASTTPSVTLTATAIRKYGTVALDSGDLAAGQIYEFIYDGTYWQLVTGTTNGAVRKYTSTGIAIPATAGNLAAPLLHGLGGAPDFVFWRLKNKGNVSTMTHGYSVGDYLDLRGCTYTADVYQVFVPIWTATQLDVSIEGLTSIVERNGLNRQAMSLTQLGQDFDLEVTAIRYSV